MARNQKEGIIMSQDIAERYNIPVEYLLKILQQLVKANVLRSKRGPRGGFTLAKSPKKITILEVFEAVEGPMRGTLHIAEHAKGDRFAAKAERLYAKAVAQAKEVFKKTRLSDLLE
jgi:Rrf2 family protein